MQTNSLRVRSTAPANIYSWFVHIRQSDDRPILTDFELVKLTETVPSVSPEHWPDDPYRALEVNGQNPIDNRADIYSFARNFYHAVPRMVG